MRYFMKTKIFNAVILAFSAFLICFVLAVSVIPGILIDTEILLLFFAMPVIAIAITMIVQIKRATTPEQKSKTRTFWLFVLFGIYIIMLAVILFFGNEYRHGNSSINISIFSKEHFAMCGFIPFKGTFEYFVRLANGTIELDIVIINIAVNLILFVPMGFFVPMLFGKKIKNVWQFIVLMLGITALVEILQFVTFTGSTDIDDIIYNTLGAVVMYLIMKTKFVRNIIKKVLE